jgi:MFS family permease
MQPGKTEAQQRATLLIFLLIGIAQAAWAPLVPYAKARVHANDQQFGLWLLCFGLGSIVSMPAMGALAGRFGCKQLIQITGVGVAVSLLCVAIAPTAWLLALSLVLFGGFIGSTDVVMNVQALLVEKSSGRSLMPKFHAFFSVGTIAGAMLMGGLLWCSLPPVLAATLVFALLLTLLLLARSGLLPYGKEPSRGHTAFAWPSGYTVLLGLLAFLTMLAEGSMLDWSALFLIDNIAVRTSHAGIGYAVFSVAMTISRLMGSRLIDRLGRKRVLVVGALLAAGGFAIAAFTLSSVIAVAGFALIGVGIANLVPLFFSMAAESGGNLGLNVSFVTTLGYAGILIGPAWIGFVVHARGFVVAFSGVALLLLVVSLLSIIAARRFPQQTLTGSKIRNDDPHAAS